MQYYMLTVFIFLVLEYFFYCYFLASLFVNAKIYNTESAFTCYSLKLIFIVIGFLIIWGDSFPFRLLFLFFLLFFLLSLFFLLLFFLSLFIFLLFFLFIHFPHKDLIRLCPHLFNCICLLIYMRIIIVSWDNFKIFTLSNRLFYWICVFGVNVKKLRFRRCSHSLFLLWFIIFYLMLVYLCIYTTMNFLVWYVVVLVWYIWCYVVV